MALVRLIEIAERALAAEIRVTDGEGQPWPGLEQRQRAAVVGGDFASLMVPLRSKSGMELGAVIATGPLGRNWSDEDRETLNNLAALVVDRWECDAQIRDLRASEARSQALMEAQSQIIWTATPEGIPDYCSPGILHQLGRTAEEFLSPIWTRHLHPDDRPWAEARWLHSIRTGEDYEVEFRIQMIGGEYPWFLVRALPLRDDAGAITRWIGSCTNINDRILAEISIRQAEERVWLVLESTAEGIYGIDADGYCEFINRSGAALLGYEPSEVMGCHMHSLVHHHHEDGREFPASDCPIYKSIHAIESARIDDDIMWKKDGTPFHVAYSASPIRRDGRSAGAVVAFRDISAHKQSERDRDEFLAREREARRKAEQVQAKVEAAGQAKDRFLAMLSHELRTPINPVLLLATSLADDPETPDEMRPTWRMIRDNIGLEARLIDDLLDVMKTIQGKMIYEWDVHDAHDLIDKTMEIVRSEARAKSLRLDVQTRARLTQIRADKARLTQAFWNLARNAIKFTPEGGTIRLSTCEDAGRLIVEIEDDGIGIDPPALGRIFNAFEQVEDSITREYGGLGLGLAISKSVVEAHGGTITARSQGLGQGATFTVSLPLTMETSSLLASPLAKLPTTGRRPLRILFVEDDPMTCRVMGSLLRKAGYSVTTAMSYEAALEVASPEFDLVVSDIGLPGRSGFELMRQLKDEHGLIGIALTGFGQDGDIQKGRDAGFVKHMTKPVDFPRLEWMILDVANAHDLGF